jgi:hypothetical protein
MASHVTSGGPTGMPMGPMGVPPYPGNPQINALPGEQYNPYFDSMFARGTQTVPSLNALFDDVNAMQTAIFAPNPQNPGGLGYLPMPPSALPPFGTPTSTPGGETPPGTHAASASGVHNQSINHSA